MQLGIVGTCLIELDTNSMYTQQNPNWVIMTNTLTVVLKNTYVANLGSNSNCDLYKQ